MNKIKKNISPHLTPGAQKTLNFLKHKENHIDSIIKDRVNLNYSSKIPSEKNIPSPINNKKKIISSNPEKELTVLYYMNGQYKDIGHSVADSIKEMEKAGSNKDVNMVAQLGKLPYEQNSFEKIMGQGNKPQINDWSGVKRFEIKHNSHKEMDASLKEYEKLEPQFKDNPLYYFNIADEEWNIGSRDKATQYYKKADNLGMKEYMANPQSLKSKKINEEFQKVPEIVNNRLKAKDISSSTIVGELPKEAQMSNPENLKDFISWGMQKYPAKHYMVVFMGHGNATKGALGMSPKDMSKAVKDGIKEANIKSGRNDKIDAAVFNSCYMGNIESAYEMKDMADISISSQYQARSNMFGDWDKLMGMVNKNIKEDNKFDAKEFANDMVSFYKKEGQETKDKLGHIAPYKQSFFTLSAIDNKKLRNLVNSWNKFNATCKEQKVSLKDLFKAVEDAKNYPEFGKDSGGLNNFFDDIRDMGSIMDNIKKSPEISDTVKKAADAVKKSLKEVIFNEQHSGVGMEGSSGMTVWAPTDAADFYENGGNLAQGIPNFVKDSNWGNVLSQAASQVPKETGQNYKSSFKAMAELEKEMQKPNLSESQIKGIQQKYNKAKEQTLKFKEEARFSRNSL